MPKRLVIMNHNIIIAAILPWKSVLSLDKSASKAGTTWTGLISLNLGRDSLLSSGLAFISTVTEACKGSHVARLD
jgi:hypothetical protein